MSESFIYRLEDEHDFFATENLTREAFWDVYKPGCDEHLLLRNLRKAPCYIRQLSFLCVRDGGILGAVYSSRAEIRDGDATHAAICVGPIAVSPPFQGRGIGLKLLDLTMSRARELGYPCALLFGNPAYYRKAGFSAASGFGIHLADGSDMDAFMCHPLDGAKMASIKGRYYEDPVFTIDANELEEFERLFPAKEKHKLPGQIFG